LSTREWKLLYRAIYRNVGGTATYIESADYREINTGPASSYTSASHTVLTGRDTADSHPAAAIAPVVTGFDCNLGATDDDLQKVADKFDNYRSVTAQASSPRAVLVTETSRFFTNEGASGQIIFNLPAAFAGAEFTFYVQAAYNLRFVADTGDTIRLGSTVSKAAGYVESAVVGDCVRIKAINVTEWVAETWVGAWTVETV
jgi:hypothetical protein